MTAIVVKATDVVTNVIGSLAPTPYSRSEKLDSTLVRIRAATTPMARPARAKAKASSYHHAEEHRAYPRQAPHVSQTHEYVAPPNKKSRRRFQRPPAATPSPANALSRIIGKSLRRHRFRNNLLHGFDVKDRLVAACSVDHALYCRHDRCEVERCANDYRHVGIVEWHPLVRILVEREIGLALNVRAGLV